MRKLVALILAKADSGRLKNKNTLMFHGKPMFLWNVEKCVSLFDKTYVSSDSEDILDWADSRGAIAIKRPADLCGDTPNILVYKHALLHMGDVDGIVAVQANSPTVSTEVIEKVKDAMQYYDEVMTIDSQYNRYGSVWGLSRERLASYKTMSDYYGTTPDYKVKDRSIDIHTIKDFNKALKQHEENIRNR